MCEFGCEELRSEAAILGQIGREAVGIFRRVELAVGFLASSYLSAIRTRSIFQLEGHFDGLHRLDGLSVEQCGLIAELAGGIDSGHY